MDKSVTYDIHEYCYLAPSTYHINITFRDVFNDIMRWYTYWHWLKLLTDICTIIIHDNDWVHVSVDHVLQVSNENVEKLPPPCSWIRTDFLYFVGGNIFYIPQAWWSDSFNKHSFRAMASEGAKNFRPKPYNERGRRSERRRVSMSLTFVFVYYLTSCTWNRISFIQV